MTTCKPPKRAKSARPKPSVRATRRQSSGSGRGQTEPLVQWRYYKAALLAYSAEYKKLLQAQARIRELEAQLSRRSVRQRSK